jgi:hypothetical protein
MADRRGASRSGPAVARSAPPGERAPCTAQNRSGVPCGAFALPRGAFCKTHDPDRAAAVREARARGGAKASRVRALRAQRAALDTVGGLVTFTARVIHDVADGQMAVDIARVALYGVSVQQRLLEASDLEKRIAELEAAQPAQRGRQWR